MRFSSFMVLAAGLTIPVAAVADDPVAGGAILENSCAGCHAVGKTGDSPLAAAPAFRDMFHDYQPADLAESLAEGIVAGHEDMPEWQFQPEDVGNIIAYLDELIAD